MHRSRFIACIPVCVLTSACVGASDSSHALSVTDSAGVRIVHNTSSQMERDGGAWSVSPEPAVVIGSMAGGEAYLFDHIMGLERLSDGRWVVADMGSSQIRYFDASGEHLYSAGRSGAGPGEFGQILGLFQLSGDTLAVDDFPMRTHLLDENARFVGLITGSGRPSDAQTHPVGAFGDGTLIAATLSATPQRLTEPHAMTMAYTRIMFEHDADAVRMNVLDTIGVWDTIRLVPGWRNTSNRITFDVPVQTALSSNGIVVGDPAHNEVRLYGEDGNLRTIVRRDWTPVPVTEQDIERARSRFVNAGGEGGGRVPQQLLDQRKAIAESWVIAEHMPAFSGMSIDPEDNIWLRNYVPNEETAGPWAPWASPVAPTRWTVIRNDGALLGEVELPARFLPLEFASDLIGGIYRDESDVEYVHVYSLQKS